MDEVQEAERGDAPASATSVRENGSNGRAVSTTSNGNGAVANGNSAAASPGLVFFYSERSGPSRRVDGFLAQVLQRRGNHRTFRLYRVTPENRPDLLARFGVEELPTLLVVEERKVRGRLVKPRGCDDIESFLAPWLK